MEKNSENLEQFPPRNERDEELSPDEELNAESEPEATGVRHASQREPDEETSVEDITRPSELWREARHLEVEKPESPADSGVEIPSEELGEQEIDDPVRMYLHEIGRVHLLTAEDEKV